MGQVTIYLDDETERKMQVMVKESGMSESGWIAGLIREKAVEVWPERVRRQAGAWKDFPDAEALRQDLVEDAGRESL